jgi:hypothetical protein
MESKRLSSLAASGRPASLARVLAEENLVALAPVPTVATAVRGCAVPSHHRRGAPARPSDFVHSRGRHDPTDIASLPFLQPIVRPKPRIAPAAASITGE